MPTAPMLAPLEVLRRYRPHDGSLHDAFCARLETRAQMPFVIDEGRTLSWADFHAAYLRLAQVLAARGVRRGARVAVVGRNHRTHLLALFALARLGAAMVPVNPEFGEREMGHCLGLAAVDGVIVHAEQLAGVSPIAAALPAPPWLLVYGDGDGGAQPGLEAAMAAAPAGDPVAGTGTGAVPAGGADDTCVIIFTSGTTGFPKGVMHAQSSLVAAGEANVERVHLQPDDRLLVVLPFFHMNALFYSAGGALAAGAALVLVPRFSASTFWQTAADNRATVVNVIEAMGSILRARDRAEYRPDHCLRVAYGVRAASAGAFRREFGVEHIFSGFGMTEIPGVTCNPFDGPDKPGSMGVVGRHPDPARPWAQCRVVDETGHDVPVGTAGELWVKTPIVMQGYFRDPEQTRAAFRDGWLATGDLVRQDEDGFFFHLSRIKDVIRRRGENIAAAELEAVVGEYPGVAEAAALAVPSELGEDDILMAVVARPGVDIAHQAIADWCRARLAPAKVPRYVAFIDTMPHTPTHKISKAALRADTRLRAAMVDLQAARAARP